MIDAHERLLYYEEAMKILRVPAYSFFVALGIGLGLIYYFRMSKKKKTNNRNAILIVSAALVFGTIGSKIPLIFEYKDLHIWIASKSIVGGLIGGMIGVYITKSYFKIKQKMGNIIAPAAALGVAVGRIGCYFNGCCYGKIGAWGVDFGDGYLRYPTQLLEVAFHGSAFVLLHNFSQKVKSPGILFKLYVLIYFIFRFFIEYIRVNPIIWYSFTVYQIISFAAICFIGINLIKIKKGAQNG